eukprot:3544617-Amphidinium_carterae.1
MLHAARVLPINQEDPLFDGDHHCHVCMKYHATLGGLLTHTLRAHNLPGPFARRVTNNVCPTCSSHLTRSSCVIFATGQSGIPLVYSTPAMSIEDYFQNVGMYNRVDSRLTREHIPRRGPI